MRTNFTLACLIVVLVSAAAVAGDLEPPAPPGPTMKTLNEMPPTWSQILDSTDGDPVTGCNSSRFKCVMGGEAVLDLETGLVWERVPSETTFNVPQAQEHCELATTGGRGGWRLPRIQDLRSLLDYSSAPFTLPQGIPFNVGANTVFWSGTWKWQILRVAQLNITDGSTLWQDDDNNFYGAWCVRGGQPQDPVFP